MEKEFTDPAPYYYNGGGQFYNPQMVRSLSETSQTSSSGTGGPSPVQLPYGPGSQGNGSFGQWYLGQLNPHFGQFDPAALSDINFSVGDSEGGLTVIPVGAIAEAIYELVSFFEWLFGGSSAPPTPRQLLHGRHPLYDQILGVSDGLVPDESSEGLKVCGDPSPSKQRPLSGKPQYQKPGSSPKGGLTPEQHDRFVGNLETLTVGGALAGCGCGYLVGGAPGCVGGVPIGIGAFLYLGYKAASRGTLPPPQEDDLPHDRSGLP
jgi:hypothetical protein